MAEPSKPTQKRGMLSFAKDWLDTQDITGAKAEAKRKGELYAAEIAEGEQGAQKYADRVVESGGLPVSSNLALLERLYSLAHPGFAERKDTALIEAQSRQLGKQAEESLARAGAKRQEAELSAKARGFGSNFYKNLTEGQQEGYNVLASTLGEEDLKLADKIPRELLPKFLQQIPQMKGQSTPEQMREFVVATINNGESYLDDNQKFLSKQKAQQASLEREQKLQERIAGMKAAQAQETKIREEKAIQEVRNEYAGMSPDQIIAHYQKKYGEPKYSDQQKQNAINRMDDEIDQRAAAKLGMKYSPQRGLY